MYAAMKPASNASPAPVVSRTCTAGAAIRRAPASSTTIAPLAPSLITVWRRPSARAQARQASAPSPQSISAASFWLGRNQVTARQVAWLAGSVSQAGLKPTSSEVVQPARANSGNNVAANAAGNGIAKCTCVAADSVSMMSSRSSNALNSALAPI